MPRPRLAGGGFDRLERLCPAQTPRGIELTDFLKSEAVRVLPERAPPGTPVTLFGSEWCKACELAKMYMDRRHIPYVEEDPDDGGPGERHYRETLAAADLPEKTPIPVVNARGVVMVGFFPCALDAVWAAP